MKQHNKAEVKKPKFRIDEIVLVLVVAALAFAVSIYEKSSNVKNIDANQIAEIMTDDHYMSLASNGVIDNNKLKEMQKTDYITLKSQLNIKNDFCVYIEDSDGNVIAAKGSSKLSRELSYCKE